MSQNRVQLRTALHKRPALGRRTTVRINTGSRLRNACFTINNPTAEEKDLLSGWIDAKPDDVSYVVAQLEVGENGTHHFQGYIELNRRLRFNVLKDLLGGRAHIERRMGTSQQAADYCKKEDTRYLDEDGRPFLVEAGLISNQGRRGVARSTISEIATKLKEGTSLEEIDEEHPGQFLLHKNKITDYYIEQQGQRHLTPDNNNVHIYVGPSGAGKTTTAWRLYPEAYKGVWPSGGRWWWPDYRGQETIIFDEFRENLSYQQMLALLDIHPMSIEYKGGNSQNISKRIIITTIRDPKEWYKKVEDKSELERRINENCRIFDFDNFKAEPRTDPFEFDPYEEPDNGLNFNRKFE